MPFFTPPDAYDSHRPATCPICRNIDVGNCPLCRVTRLEKNRGKDNDKEAIDFLQQCQSLDRESVPGGGTTVIAPQSLRQMVNLVSEAFAYVRAQQQAELAPQNPRTAQEEARERFARIDLSDGRPVRPASPAALPAWHLDFNCTPLTAEEMDRFVDRSWERWKQGNGMEIDPMTCPVDDLQRFADDLEKRR